MTVEYERVKAAKRKRMEFIWRHKAELGCARCGESHPACLDLHHIDPETKEPLLTKSSTGKRHLKSRWCYLGIERIKAELEKCEVLCSNCHRKQTALERGWRMPGINP